MKKILLIADSNMSLSGVPVVFMSIVRQLYKQYIFDIVVLKDNDMYFEKEFLSYGGKVFRFNFMKPNSFLSKLKWLTNEYPNKVKKFLSNNLDLKEYDAIHSFNEGFSYPFLKEAKKTGIRNIILHINSAASAYHQKKTFSQIMFRWYQRKAFKLCSKILFVSKQSLILNNYKNKGIILYNTYDEEKYGHIITCNHNNLVLTHIATFSSRKNQLFSLDVVKRISEQIPTVILNLIGSERENFYLSKINDFITENKLQDNVRILDPKSDQMEVYKSTTCALLPSTMESFGLVLIESQACGIHCFANKNLPHDADMGNIDFIKLDSTLWAKKIIEYFNKNGNKRKKSINKERFSTQQFIDTLNNLYK